MSGKGSFRKFAGLLALALIAAAVAIRCASLGRALVKKPEVSLARVGARDFGPSGATLVFGLRVENPNSFALRVDAVRYELELNGKAFAKSELDRPAEIPAKGQGIVDIPVPVKFSELFAHLMDFFATRSSKYRIKGDADFGLLTVPFESSGDVKFDGKFDGKRGD